MIIIVRKIANNAIQPESQNKNEGTTNDTIIEPRQTN
jgi:hypothetical protein